ncbi:DUF2202 domain-containing protein [Candidatus Woesearchaeota archaeon]|nr:DUF2202 domain-containing protein [Candidatus Woesearchaeota archaeon]
MKKIILILIICILVSSFVLAQGPRAGMVQQQRITENIAGGESSDLSEAEIEGLKLMREEEKLARDVYLELYDEWNLPIFNNIASSEQTHTNVVKALLEAYGIEDPVVSDERGVFTNSELGVLYNSLIEKGKNSLIDALIIGATIEDLDIKDLDDLLEMTDNEDITLVYENLRKGSRNHIRSFNRQIVNNGGTYEAQYISAEELELILSGEQETGAIIDEESNIVTGFQSQLRRQGTYSDSRGNRLSVRRQGNQIMMESRGRSINCTLCDNLSQEGERVRARLSNGRNADIKIMPETASETALQRLRLRNCDENCTIELKEVGSGEQAKAAYELRAQRNARVFGIFRARMNVQAQVDAETGEMLQVRKPWWAFLATEAEE